MIPFSFGADVGRGVRLLSASVLQAVQPSPNPSLKRRGACESAHKFVRVQSPPIRTLLLRPSAVFASSAFHSLVSPALFRSWEHAVL